MPIFTWPSINPCCPRCAAHLQSYLSVCETCFIIARRSQQESCLPGMHVEEIDIQNVVWFTLDPGNNWTHARGWMCVCDWQRWKQDGGGLAGSSHSEDRGPQGPSCCFLCHRLPLAHAPRMVVFHAQANPLRQVLLSCLLPFRELKFGPAEDTRNKYPSWEWSQGLLRWTHHLFIFKILITFFPWNIFWSYSSPSPNSSRVLLTSPPKATSSSFSPSHSLGKKQVRESNNNKN